MTNEEVDFAVFLDREGKSFGRELLLARTAPRPPAEIVARLR